MVAKNETPLEIFLDGLENGFGKSAYDAKCLLEAAPALLAACHTALSLIKSYWVEEHGNPVVGLAWGEIERAIAKAEGR